MSNKHNRTHPIAPIIDQEALCPPYIHMHLYNMQLDEAGASRGNTEITDGFYYKTNVQINRARASNYIIYVHDFIIHVHLSSRINTAFGPKNPHMDTRNVSKNAYH